MSSPLSFAGRVVIVTGAGGGMGRSHAKLLASRGACVVVNDVRHASDVVAEIAAGGGSVVADEHDISAEDGARRLVETALGAFGGVDAVINNAGVSCHYPFSELSAELFDRTLRVNTYGPFFVTKAAWQHLSASRSGRVVMVASKAAVVGALGFTAYAASKGALLSMTRQLACEGVAHGIHVNALLPSALTPMSRGKESRDARLAAKLGADPSDVTRLEDRSCAVTSAVAAWLCHPECDANGEFFNAVSGEASRFSFMKSRGFTDPGLTPEMVRDEIETIMDMAGAVQPPTLWHGDAAS